MRLLQYVLSWWRGVLSACVAIYTYEQLAGPLAWLMAFGCAGVFHKALVRFVPVRVRHTQDDSHGSASFATNRDIAATGNLAPAISSERYLLGVALDQRRRGGPFYLRHCFALSRKPATLAVITTRCKITYDGQRGDDGHLVTVGSAGSSKGLAVVQPNLRAYEGPTVTHDPKGENYLRTVDARVRLGHHICVVDPFSALPEAQRAGHLKRLNPLDALEEHYRQGRHADVVDESAALAEMMIVRAGSERDPHWNNKASAFLKAAIMFVTYGRGYQNRDRTPLALSTVKDCIYEYFGSDERVQTFIKRCQESPYLRAVAGQAGMIAPTERSSVLSTLLEHTDFLDSPSVRHSLGATDFNLLDLKTQKLSIYLVLPANNLKAYNRLARLWVGTLLRAMMRDSLVVPRWRVLFMLDEVATLGRMDSLEQAMTLGRGYGIDVWLIFQDIHQMKDAYGESWESLLANARVQQFLGVQDVTTAEYVSKKLGQATIQTLSHSQSSVVSSGSNWGRSHSQGGQGSSSVGGNTGRSSTSGASIQQTGRALLQPDEVVRLPQDQLLIFIAGQYPVLAQKCSVLSPAVAQALEAVRPIDAPAALPPRGAGVLHGEHSAAYAQAYEPVGVASAGAAQLAQTQAHEREYVHARGL